MKVGVDITIFDDITRMYLAHPGISTKWIVNRIKIKRRWHFLVHITNN